ncbi:MAG: MlaD family protein [Candidatus Omnitrophica bacterium]|nr:MlaD family protein [Candidatus Omnitrophota bacterium]MDD5437067.1 MlaD family protein [Candidatus Omnitrophota bacterium]
MKITNEFKTGIIVVAGLLAAAVFYAKTTDLSAKPYHLKTYFNYAEGIKADSIVKLAGIDVGRVEKIEFKYIPETKIELILAIDKKAKIHEDSIAFISTSGMIGDAYIGITPGSPDRPFVKEDAMLMSEDPVEMRKLMKQADAITASLDKTLSEVKSLASNVNSVVSDNKVRIDSIASNLESTAVNFKEFSEDIKQHPWKLLMKGK